MKKIFFSILALAAVAGIAVAATTVPGHTGKWDGDNNGYPDAGKEVNGHYTSLYAYDASDWYWDLGDGRVQGTVSSVDDLDPETLTTCDYIVNYRGTFENDPFMDSGWIMNNIKCSGYDDNGNYKYDIVHETDPRYEGNPDWAIWGNWEYHVLVESKSGNLVRPESHQ
ncbi:MAG: hypothetical protein Q8P45_03510 [Candidatus Harrisonbacteria bacterium]|nr:hypothetical protein [Candidatus Harrisonbacteria bacterium]